MPTKQVRPQNKMGQRHGEWLTERLGYLYKRHFINDVLIAYSYYFHHSMNVEEKIYYAK
jgi:hypothetical protein